MNKQSVIQEPRLSDPLFRMTKSVEFFSRSRDFDGGGYIYRKKRKRGCSYPSELFQDLS